MNIKVVQGSVLVLEKNNIEYEKKDNTIKWKMDGQEHNLNLETLEFTRENEEYIFYLDILEEKCEITLKNESYYLQVPVEYANLLENKNIYEITYRIETSDEEIKIWIELEGNQI